MSTAEFLDRFGLRHAAGARAAVGVLMAVAAPFAAPPAGVAVCSLVAVVLAGWSLVYLHPDADSAADLGLVVDIAFMCGLCLAQSVLVDPSLLVRFLGWVSPISSLAVVALQWHVRPLPGAIATVLVRVAYVVGASASPEVTVAQAPVAGGVRTAVEAALSRLLWLLVRRGGRIADEHMADRFAAELAAELATLIDIAERRGVEVLYSERGPRAIPPPDVRQGLLDEVGAGLLCAEHSARVTLSGMERTVVLSVVSDAAEGRVAPGELTRADGSTSITVVGDGRTWVEARWAPRS
jgi:hypothetical protein